MGAPADPAYGKEFAAAPPGGPDWWDFDDEDDETEESVEEDMSGPYIMQPAYAFKAKRPSGAPGWVKFYFDDEDRLVEIREFDDRGALARRAGYFKDGVKTQQTEQREDRPHPLRNPVVRAQLDQAIAALTAPSDELAEAAIRKVMRARAVEEKKISRAKGKAGQYGDLFSKMWDKDSEEFDDDWAKDARAAYAKKYGLKIMPAKEGGERIPADGKKAQKQRRLLRGKAYAAKMAKKDAKKGKKKGKKTEALHAPGNKDQKIRYLQDEIGRLEAERTRLTELVNSMAVQHKLEAVLREHPELNRLKDRLAKFESVEELEAEASTLVKVIHEAGGGTQYTPSGRSSVVSTDTPGAPKGPITEAAPATPLVESRTGDDNTFSRAKEHRRRQREEGRARASRLGTM